MTFENRNSRDSRGSKFGGRSSSRDSGRGRDSGRDSGRSFSRGRDSGRGRGSSDREMHSAKCDECGSKCELPFKPTGEKPVLCSDCFRKAGPSRGRSNSGVDLSEINKKLDKILELLE